MKGIFCMPNSLYDTHNHSPNEFTVDQKLELIRQVRSQYRQNQNDLMHRESILYNRPIRPLVNNDTLSTTDVSYSDSHKKGSQTDGTLKIRCITAALLTVLVILFHDTGINPAGLNIDQVFLTLEQDYEEVILSWSSSLIQAERY